MADLRVCQRCGRVTRQHRRLGLAVDGALSVQRTLCLRCLDEVLELAGRALAPQNETARKVAG